MRKITRSMKKFWKFVWDDNSIWSWITCFILAFVLIKFVFYPLLGMIFQTPYPIVGVMSGSMEHRTTNPCLNYMVYPGGRRICLGYDTSKYVICGNEFSERQKIDFERFWNLCGEFYTGLNITKTQFKNFRFSSGFNTGDLMFLFGKSEDEIKIGDTIVFISSNQAGPIIHRVVDINQIDGNFYFQTKGDHNQVSDDSELRIPYEDIIGVAKIRVPYLGYIKIGYDRLVISLRRLIS